jgi:hypothetical protein
VDCHWGEWEAWKLPKGGKGAEVPERLMMTWSRLLHDAGGDAGQERTPLTGRPDRCWYHLQMEHYAITRRAQQDSVSATRQ